MTPINYWHFNSPSLTLSFFMIQAHQITSSSFVTFVANDLHLLRHFQKLRALVEINSISTLYPITESFLHCPKTCCDRHKAKSSVKKMSSLPSFTKLSSCTLFKSRKNSYKTNFSFPLYDGMKVCLTKSFWSNTFTSEAVWTATPEFASKMH